MKTAIVIPLLVSLTGCIQTLSPQDAYLRQQDEQQMIERARNADIAMQEARIRKLCEYAIEDKYRYGDCIRQETNAHISRQQQYESQMMMQAQARKAQEAADAQRQSDIGMQLLMQAQPKPAPIQPQRMLNCNSSSGAFGQVNTTCW